MRCLCKITLLIIIMTLTTATASADKYSRAWKKVEKLIKDDLPESAAKEINQIWDMAAEDNDGRQMLKSAVYITQVQQSYSENSISSGLELFNTLLPKLRVQEHKALCHAFIAKGYIRFWELNKYRFRTNDPSDEENLPLERWTARMICDTICYHLDQSIKLAGDVSSGYYQEFFPGGNKAGQKLRPNLVDMLMDNAIVLITDYRLSLGKRTFFNDSRLYGTMHDFLAATIDVTPDDPDLWMIYVLRRLTQHNYGAKPDIRCTIDIRRMQVLDEYLSNDGKWDRNDEEWLKGAVALAESYTKKVKFSTMLCSKAARKITDSMGQEMSDEKAENLMRQARDICIAAQKKWPKSEGALECLGIKDEIERKSVRITLDSDLVPGERNIAKLNFRNVNTIYLKLVEATGRMDRGKDEITLMSELNQSSTVVEWSMRVDDPGDFMEHSAFADITPVMQGCYYLLASTGPYFNSGDCIAYEYLECNGIRFLNMVQNNGTLYGRAVDTRSGKPIPDCKYTVWKTNYNDELVKVATSGITGSDGYILVEGLANSRYRIELEGGGSRGNATFNIPWKSDMPERQYVRVFTDRFTYLPGDSVQYSGVVYTNDGENGHVLAGVTVNVTIEFYDMNGDGDDEASYALVTDSMGVFKGSYKIPENCMPGSIEIVAESDEDDKYDFAGSRAIKVESFRQPKFEVKIDDVKEEARYDKPVTITGKAISFTGIPVDGASVTWYAGVGSFACHRFCILDDRGDVRIGAGQAKTGSDGSFSFDVTVPGDIMVEEFCWVHVNAVVTDLNGETHEYNISYGAWNKAEREIYVTSQGSVLGKNGLQTLYLRLTSTANNNLVSGNINVKVSRLSWLETPGLPLPFSIVEGREKKDLSKCISNQHLKERFPRYDFDLNGEDIMEIPVFEGVVPFDKDDRESMMLMLDGLQPGIYRVTANSAMCKESVTEFTFFNEDDYSFMPQKSLLCSFDKEKTSRGIYSAEVGDTARIRLGNSRKGTLIHYIIENKYGVYDRGMLESNGKQQILSIPVTEELVGMFAVHCCVIYEGVSENRSFQFEVPDRPKQLRFELETFRNILEPDEAEEWNIRISDWQGNPVTAAIMLDMYDRALDKYGVNRIVFSPFGSKWVGGRSLLQNGYNTSGQYAPWLHVFGNSYEYKGKRAITGTLIDPFMNYSRRARGMRMYKSNEMAVDLVADVAFNASAQSVPLASAATINQADFEGLGITTVDEALQGGLSNMDIVFDTRSLPEEELQGVIDEQSGAVAIRSDLNPTGLFGYLVTDSTGRAVYRFRVPQLLTEWKIQGIAFTDSLQTGRVDTILVTRKKIMVEPASPRFLRQGDRMEFTVKVSNMTEQNQKAVVTMTLTDAVTGKALGIIEGGYKKNVTVPAEGSASTSFTIKVPAGLTAVTYRLTAETTGHSDGIQETIPVLSNRTQVTQALSLFNNGSEKRTFRFEVLDKPRSSTMADEELTLEYSATPIWYAIQSLPIMIRVDDPSNLRLFHSMMGAAISQDLSSRYPAIRQMLDEWAELPASEWQTQLERNERLTGTLLEETPWLRSSRNERDRLRSLAKDLGSEETAQAFGKALRKIMDNQNSDGSWSWLDGSPASLHITDEIMQGLGLLIENGIIEVTPELKVTLQKGLDYMDSLFFKRYDAEKKPESLGYSELNYLLTRSYYTSYPFNGKSIASHTFFTRLAEIEDTHNLSLYFRSQLALLMSRNGKKELAEHIAATLVERSLYSDEMGRYWRDNEGGLLWHEAPIETQALIIRTLLAVGREKEAVEAARWLLKQKQTTGWGSSPATAAAVTALMATGSNVQLESDPDITIYVGKEAVKASDSKATAGYTTKTWQGPISRDKADITVDAKTAGISWGAVYRSFTEELDKVERQENGMSLKRTILRVIHGADGDRLEEVKEGTKLHVGDRLRIRFDLTTDRNLEYLQLADMRAASVEPVSTAAGYSYNWRDDIGYYSAPGNTRNVFYIDRLSKGSYVIEYEVNVQKPGRFTVGNAVMQCLYAPAFRATTTSATIVVE